MPKKIIQPTPNPEQELPFLPAEILNASAARLAEGKSRRAGNKDKIAAGNYLDLDTAERQRARVVRMMRDPATRQELGVTQVPAFGESFAPGEQDTGNTLLERIIGAENFLGVNFFALGQRAARCVARIEIRTPNGRSGFGTGSMVSSRLLLTNHHVLNNKDWAAGSRAQFDFEDDIEGNPRPAVFFRFAPEEFFYTNPQLDFTLVAVQEISLQPAGHSLTEYGFNSLDGSPGKIVVGEFINIIQHPSGMHKQVVLQDNRLLAVPTDWLHYEADTLPGSSGAPLFNKRWEVVGLHHAGWPARDEQGRLLTRDGTLWTQEMGETAIHWLGNEGARTSRLVETITQVKSTLPPPQAAFLDELLQLRTTPPVAPPAPPAPETIIEPSVRPFVADSPPPVAVAPPVMNAAGEVTFTVPLQITLRLGQPLLPSVTPPPAVSAPTAPVVTARAEAFREFAQAQQRPYFDAEADAAEKSGYYEGLDLNGALSRDQLYDALSDLLTRTHENKLAYKPARYLYPWVDLQPDRKLRSIYTGEVYEPETIIEEALAIEAELAARQEALVRESVFSANNLAEELSLLEATLAYNCEHVVPQSWFRGPGSAAPKGDLHHLFTCRSSCNSFRGNVPYWDFPDFDEAEMQGCGRRDGNRFEPAHGKGPAARATLYFLLRYPGLIDDNASELQAERLNTIIAWHTQEPVTEYELHRNSVIYRKQGNRNPLIDFPVLAGNVNFTRGLRRANG